MAAWSVYRKDREIRRYKSKAAAVAGAKRLQESGWDVVARKTIYVRFVW